ncbi:hypothetical protein MKW92_006358, partial [Papaver armeniacum]
IEENGIESKEDDEKTEEELVEKQYATAYKRKLWLKSLTKKNIEKRKRDCGDDIDSNVKEKKKKENGVVYCCKTDGQGWHCRSKAQKGKPLCKHHLIQMQSNSDDQRDNNQEKKIQKLEKKTARRGQKEQGKLSGKKSSEFVYYSGFGPLWGKNKRGRPPNEVKKQQEDSEKEDAEEEDAEEECEKLEERQEVIDEAPVIDDDQTSPKMNIVKEENVNNNGCMFIEDEFDDDDDSMKIVMVLMSGKDIENPSKLDHWHHCFDFFFSFLQFLVTVCCFLFFLFAHHKPREILLSVTLF